MGIVAVGTGSFDVADLLVLRPSGAPLLVEVKTRKSGRRPGGLSRHQAAAGDYCRKSNYGWVTLWAIGDVRREPVSRPSGRQAFRLHPPPEVRLGGSSQSDIDLVRAAWEAEEGKESSTIPPVPRKRLDARPW